MPGSKPGALPLGDTPILFWCSERDSNSHIFRRQNLNLVCLPIPPSEHFGWGRRTRTLESRDQNPPPYQLGYSPILFWCSERDSNSHTFWRQNLNLVCLPIPPSEHFWLGYLDSNQGVPVSKTGALPLGDTPICYFPFLILILSLFFHLVNNYFYIFYLFFKHLCKILLIRYLSIFQLISIHLDIKKVPCGTLHNNLYAHS